jgi:hypothetical protein
MVSQADDGGHRGPNSNNRGRDHAVAATADEGEAQHTVSPASTPFPEYDESLFLQDQAETVSDLFSLDRLSLTAHRSLADELPSVSDDGHSVDGTEADDIGDTTARAGPAESRSWVSTNEKQLVIWRRQLATLAGRSSPATAADTRATGRLVKHAENLHEWVSTSAMPYISDLERWRDRALLERERLHEHIDCLQGGVEDLVEFYKRECEHSIHMTDAFRELLQRVHSALNMEGESQQRERDVEE